MSNKSNPIYDRQRDAVLKALRNSNKPISVAEIINKSGRIWGNTPSIRCSQVVNRMSTIHREIMQSNSYHGNGRTKYSLPKKLKFEVPHLGTFVQIPLDPAISDMV